VILKIVLFFLLFMGVLGMFGGLRLPKSKTLDKLRNHPRLEARKCPKCGAYRIGKGPCSCDKGKG
jgi:uncharacterized protein YneF (UPF0154 family)